MTTNAHFQNLPALICQHLQQARREVLIAVCWFTHRDIYETLKSCVQRGLKVELIIEYDTQNIRTEGLDFSALIRAGMALYARREVALMHHKFVLIDGHLVLNGSFNWTYNTNAENLLVHDDPGLCRIFKAEFEHLKAGATRIFKVLPKEAKPFSTFPLFETTRFQLADLRKKIGQGARTWRLNTDKMYQQPAAVFRETRLPFDPLGLLEGYWTRWRMWDAALFEGIFTGLKQGDTPYPALRELRLWALRMRVGDLVFATIQTKQLAAIGMVQSEPQRFEGRRFAAFRAVQWLKVLDLPLLFGTATPAQRICAFRGSALAVLQAVYEDETKHLL